jgi:hypothetical protein
LSCRSSSSSSSPVAVTKNSSCLKIFIFISLASGAAAATAEAATLLHKFFLFYCLYGYYSVQSTSFPKCRLLSEEYIYKQNATKFGWRDKDVFEVTLLGASVKDASQQQHLGDGAAEANKKKKKNNKQAQPQLIYALSSHRPKAKIKNLVQASAAILSQSKTIFFGKLLCLLRHYDPRLVELLYTGKLLQQHKKSLFY